MPPKEAGSTSVLLYARSTEALEHAKSIAEQATAQTTPTTVKMKESKQEPEWPVLETLEVPKALHRTPVMAKVYKYLYRPW